MKGTGFQLGIEIDGAQLRKPGGIEVIAGKVMVWRAPFLQ